MTHSKFIILLLALLANSMVLQAKQLSAVEAVVTLMHQFDVNFDTDYGYNGSSAYFW